MEVTTHITGLARKILFEQNSFVWTCIHKTVVKTVFKQEQNTGEWVRWGDYSTWDSVEFHPTYQNSSAHGR